MEELGPLDALSDRFETLLLFLPHHSKACWYFQTVLTKTRDGVPQLWLLLFLFSNSIP